MGKTFAQHGFCAAVRALQHHFVGKNRKQNKMVLDARAPRSHLLSGRTEKKDKRFDKSLRLENVNIF